MSIRSHRGFTLIELMIVIALVAIVATLAAPSFTNMLARKRVEGVTAELATDFQYAKSEAVGRNADVRVTFVDSKCYVIHRTSLAVSTCVTTGTGLLKTMQLDAESTASIAPNNGLSYVSFEPVRGVATNDASPAGDASINVTSSVGSWTLRSIVTPLGRVQTCTPSGTGQVPGYAACS